MLKELETDSKKCGLVGYVRGNIKELILPEKLGMGVPPASQNPYPI